MFLLVRNSRVCIRSHLFSKDLDVTNHQSRRHEECRIAEQNFWTECKLGETGCKISAALWLLDDALLDVEQDRALRLVKVSRVALKSREQFCSNIKMFLVKITICKDSFYRVCIRVCSSVGCRFLEIFLSVHED
jgi:hypothetical protein